MSALDPIPHAIADGPHERRLGIRWWLLTAAIGAVLITGYLAAVGLIAFVMATAGGSQFHLATVLVAALPGWLVLHQAPLEIMGAPLSVLPLLPTALTMLLITTASAWVARRSRLRRPDQAWPLITTMGLVHAFVGAGIAVVLGGPVNVVPVDAFLCCGMAAAVASTAGVANRCGLIYLLWERVDTEVWSGMRLGLLALAALIGAGGVVLLLGVCVSAPDMAAAMARSGGAAGDAIGSTLLSLLYLPNALVAGWSFAAGPGVSVGGVTAQPLHATPGPVPDLPLLAVLPTQDSSVLWAVVLVLPLLVGGLVGAASRRVSGVLVHRFRTIGVAAVVAALATLVLGFVAGGELGNGPFGLVTVRPFVLAVMTLCWVAVPAAVVTWWAGPLVYEVDTEPEEPEPADGETDQAEETPGTETEDSSEPEDTDDDDPAVDEEQPDPEDDLASAVNAVFQEGIEELEPEIPQARETGDDVPEPAGIDPAEFDGEAGEDDRR